MTLDPDNLTYAAVIEHGQWLENRGDYSRYWIGGEETVWVNHDREEIADPDEDSDPEFYERD